MGGHNEENVKLGKGLRLFFSAFAHYKWQVLFLLIILTLSECAAIVDKFLLKYFIDYATQYTAGTVTRDYFFGVGLTIVFIFIGVYIFRIFSRWVIGIRSNHISANMIMEFKAKAYKHLLHLPQSFHTSNKTGTIISKLMRTNSAVEGMSDVFIYSLVPIIIQIVMVIGSLFVINLTSAVIIILYVAAFLGYSYFIQLRQIKPQVAYNHAEDLEKGFIADTFTNIEPIKLFGKEEYMYNRFGMFISSSKNKLLHFWKYWISSDVGLVAITGTATIAMLLFTGNAYFTGAIDLGSLVFIYTVFVSMVGPLSSFQWGMRGLYRSLGDFESLRSYLDVKNDIVDVSHAPALWISSGQVVFKDVVFHYSKKQVFEKMNLTVPAKKTVALVGKSGSGKSTLVKLLFRLYDIEEGSILIDGTSIRDVQQSSLRSSMSVVPQECILFDDTLYNNILFANPTATRDQVMRALSLAQLDDVIAGMPLAENTIVGERGIKLSGGEKQRVSIARAILADKRILVLDEATSSLDSETEFAIKKALAHLTKNRTTIIIAHRLSTIMNADKIVVLRHGQIVQQGTHATLIKQAGEYKRLWNLQKGGYIK